jgi:hypothetical protein
MSKTNEHTLPKPSDVPSLGFTFHWRRDPGLIEGML